MLHYSIPPKAVEELGAIVTKFRTLSVSLQNLIFSEIRTFNEEDILRMPCLQIRIATVPNKSQLSKMCKEVCRLLDKPQGAMLLDVQQSSVQMGENAGAICHLYSGALSPSNQLPISKCLGEHLKTFGIEYTNHYIFFHKMESSDIGHNLSLKSITQ